MDYNLNEIERRFMERVCYGKSMINKSLELFKYRDDVRAHEFINLRKNVKPQVILVFSTFLLYG